MKRKLLCVLMALCFLLSSCAPIQSQETAEEELVPTETSYSDIQSNTLRVVIDGKVNNVSGYLIDGEYYFTNEIIQSLLGSTDTLSPVKINGEMHYRLSDTANTAGVTSFVYDDVLDAIYIWTSLDEIKANLSDDSDEIAQAKKLGFGNESDNVITFAEYIKVLDHIIEIIDNTKMDEWKTKLPKARVSQKEMTRAEGFLALFYAVETLGGEYSYCNADWMTLHNRIGDPWEDCVIDWELFPGMADEVALGEDGMFQRDAASYFYAIGRSSLNTEKLIFDYDEASNSMRPADPLTVHEALLSVVRLYDSSSHYISLLADESVAYDKSIITDKLLEKANAIPEVTPDNIPYWTGFTYGWGYKNDLFKAFKETDIRNMANWGFNSLRLILDYRDLFNAEVSQVNLSALQKLDRVISYGMKYNVHIDIQFQSMPGWWTKMGNDFRYTGSLDFYTNPEHQSQSQDMWGFIAKRYKDIPNSTLSFIPFFEAVNYSRSTGTDIIKEKNYTTEDITKGLIGLIDAIKSESPQRLINFEANNGRDIYPDQSEEAAREKGVLINANYAADPFVYWTWNESGTDDRTHSHFMPDWPLTSYFTQIEITGDHYYNENEKSNPLILNGELPKNTVIEFYVSQVQGSGTFLATADGKEIFKQDVNPKVGEEGCISKDSDIYNYRTEEPFSYMQANAKSDKLISFTLEDSASEVEICFTGNHAGWMQWSEIDVNLPESYAVDRWWSESTYDAHENGTTPGTFLRKTSHVTIIPNGEYNTDMSTHGIPITINPDLTYSTNRISECADKQYIRDWVEARIQLYNSDPLLVRFESANFTGAVGDSTVKYYDDLLSVLKSYNISWLCNDFHMITIGSGGSYAGDELVQYGEYTAFDIKLLKVFQKYQ